MKKITLLVLVAVLLSSFCLAVEKYDPSSGKGPTKAQVKAFVEDAVAYAKKYGKEAAIKEFENKKGKFWIGELYIYAYDYKGVVVGHGAKPHLKGKNLYKLKDPKGTSLIKELIKQAQNGGGWVNFYWEHPIKKKNWPKLGYSAPVDDTWWLGSGMYLEK